MAQPINATIGGTFVSHHVEKWTGAKGPGRRDTLYVLSPDGSVSDLWVPEDVVMAVEGMQAKFGDSIEADVVIQMFGGSNGQPARQSVRLADCKKKAAPSKPSA